jgi:hypothetical protein
MIGKWNFIMYSIWNSNYGSGIIIASKEKESLLGRYLTPEGY